MVDGAAGCPPFASLVDVDDPRFARPGDMPERVREACVRNGERVPTTDAELVRCLLDSVALAVASALDDAQRCSGRAVRVVHMVGGGSAIHLLVELIAAATRLQVEAGPVEASAVGNLLVQLHATGQVGDREEMGAVVAGSFPSRRYQPNRALADRARAARHRYDDLVAARLHALPPATGQPRA